MAWPLRLMRAPTLSCFTPAKLAAPAMAMLWSSVKRKGRSRTCLRKMSKGMRCPSAARAKTKSVSSGRTCVARPAASVTMPLTWNVGAIWPAAEALRDACAGGGVAGAAGSLPSSRALVMPSRNCAAYSASGALAPSSVSQWRAAAA